MSDPVLALVLVVSFSAVLLAASWFKTLDTALWRNAHVPLLLGLSCGVVLRLLDPAPRLEPLLTGVVLTAAALYLRLTGRESEPADGMVICAWMGAAAAVPLIIQDEQALLRLSECILAGAIAGYGITFALAHVRDRMRQLGVDAATAAIAVGGAALPRLVQRTGLEARQIAIGSSALIPLLAVLTVFRQWAIVRAELRHEAVLGVIDDEDVHPTAHPLRRLGRAGWHDRAAHREFVRLANRIALRKRQQRGRSEEVARLYQLEVIKLRMQLQEMTRIDRAMRAAANPREATS
jgi:hypothetical protein